MTRHAHATLKAGCAFFAERAGEQPMAAAGWAQIAHTRMIGNRLRELDRFLSVLIEDVAASRGPPGHDRKRFARLRNTPMKLRVVEDMFATGADDDARLRAIGRIAACLHHCKGKVHAASIHDDVLIARGGRQRPGKAAEKPAPGGSADAAGDLFLLSRNRRSAVDTGP